MQTFFKITVTQHTSESICESEKTASVIEIYTQRLDELNLSKIMHAANSRPRQTRSDKGITRKPGK